MVIDSVKIRLIENILKEQDENLLMVAANLFKKSKPRLKKANSAHDFLGIWTNQEAQLIEKVIADGCEIVHPDDWK